MRIGIITMPLLSNYGGILQNYALQTVLKEMGHQPITFKVGKKGYGAWLLSAIKALVRLRFPSSPPWIFCKRFAGMERFVEQYIDITHRLDTFSSSHIDQFKLDALCVGSDQVWRPIYMYSMHLEDMFFHFAMNRPMLKFSYAASFGVSDWEFSEEQTRNCSVLIKQFKGISVREESGVELCRKFLGVDAQWVLDPTLLLTVAHYEKLCLHIPKSPEFLYAYILDITDKKIQFIHRVANQLGLKAVIVSAGASINADDCPEKWLSCFRDASFVITDSYHGTIFSIIFKRQFLVFANTHRGNARFDSLVKGLGIISQMVDENSQIEVDKTPDWNAIDTHLLEWKTKSYRYLDSMLNI